ncbi:hypothetical protein [Tenggerimyces flavus]|uniref:Abortive infection protein n=1 Tax=Tenggerimyces flavus TaxID=1708749 RepID=A0ABV7YAP4_9ACTN|nr:hypothetical protein [Tenggerimyces flavus]MBM7789064.1 hypothetical protein [Tenggerimyces flavus]
MRVKGISYTVEGVPIEVVHRDLRVISDELHCTTVMVLGTEIVGHLRAVRAALEAGLDVWVRPQLVDWSRDDRLAHLMSLARQTEVLRLEFPGRVTLLVGSELSFTSAGMIPGPNEFVRLQVIVRPRLRRLFDRRITRKLNVLLAELLVTARREFHGQITYAAAGWENVDWSGFDIVGVNLYRSRANAAGYEDRLRSLRQTGEPVVVTEFGCGAFVGADQRGAASFRAVDWLADPPRVREGHVRDEATQARYLTELIALYERHGLDGCFVFTFAMPDFPHRSEPRQDLDLAGFGVVKFNEHGEWERKEAFDAVADAYSRLGSRQGP